MSGILKDLADGAKRLGEIKKEFSDLEFNERILELRQLLVSAQTEILSLREKNLDLNALISDLQQKADQAAELIEIEGFKYDCVDGQPCGLPFCPTCEVRDGALFRLSRQTDEFSRCLNCNNTHNAAQNGRVNQNSPPLICNSGEGDWNPY